MLYITISILWSVAAPSSGTNVAHPNICIPQARAAAAFPATNCVTLFGDEAEQEANQQAREHLLEDVTADAYAINITHRGEWTEPVEALHPNLTLLETFVGDDCLAAALVQVHQSTVSDCEPGTYVIALDNTFGQSAVLVDVLVGHLLIDVEGELAYVSESGAQTPVWRMIWHPTWTMPRPPTPFTTQPSRHNSRRNKRR